MEVDDSGGGDGGGGGRRLSIFRSEVTSSPILGAREIRGGGVFLYAKLKMRKVLTGPP